MCGGIDASGTSRRFSRPVGTSAVMSGASSVSVGQLRRAADHVDPVDDRRFGVLRLLARRTRSRTCLSLAVAVARDEHDGVPADGELARLFDRGPVRVAEIVQPVDQLVRASATGRGAARTGGRRRADRRAASRRGSGRRSSARRRRSSSPSPRRRAAAGRRSRPARRTSSPACGAGARVSCGPRASRRPDGQMVWARVETRRMRPIVGRETRRWSYSDYRPNRRLA